jgi:signal transduction histidine kinase
MIRRHAEKKGENKISEFAMRMDQQIKHVLQMINEMLDITKIETGRLTYHDEVFDIGELVEEIVKDQQMTTDTHTISLSVKTHTKLTGDRYRIGQVIINLISNAIKYSPNATKIHVSAKKTPSTVVISIQDFGPGISKEDQSKLFQPFFRAKKTSSAKGTGIGLFISNQIVERHAGRIQVKSTVGKGSIFTIELPTKKYHT